MNASSNAGWCWLNGRIGPTAEATVGVTDHGLTVGDGIFETMKVTNGVAFALARHLRRLRRSAAALDLDVPLTDDELRTACDAVIAAATDAGDEVGRVRLTVTGGPGPSGSDRGDAGRTVLLVTGGAGRWETATTVAVVPFTRNPTGGTAGVKSTSYAENVVALARAYAVGASEAIFADVHGRLSEGTGSNVFVVRGGRLLTPALSTACLAGITRELVLEVTDAVETEDLTLDDLRHAEEAFLTSSTRDVQAIAAVDEHALPTPAPGPVTVAVADAFARLVARTTDP
ncbi:aminotransferase class IV [Iamia sp.]|uniref:aminotransferase class IV n=1 Tax=Iamia sp. TaxID=2722710 RepID=UPI002B97DDF0|nr:aminotransferase class IV [Iamia sp.]HXH55916.1 aminotransferase class IV [Iamia sp.]